MGEDIAGKGAVQRNGRDATTGAVFTAKVAWAVARRCPIGSWLTRYGWNLAALVEDAVRTRGS